MIKLAVFDLDGTLAELGKGILPQDIELLKAIEDKGVTIAISSGKPTYYLCGFMRQVGLENPILIGENGAVIQFGVDLPPKQFYVLPYSKEAKQTISFIKEEVSARFPHMWFQPNEVGITPFPRNEEEFAWIENFLCASAGVSRDAGMVRDVDVSREAGMIRDVDVSRDASMIQDADVSRDASIIRDVDVYRHVDSFDVVPKGIDKKAGLECLGKLLHVSAEETVAVGDGVNDYPMFEYAGCSIGIGVKEEARVDRNFGALGEALEYLLNMV